MIIPILVNKESSVTERNYSVMAIVCIDVNAESFEEAEQRAKEVLEETCDYVRIADGLTGVTKD